MYYNSDRVFNVIILSFYLKLAFIYFVFVVVVVVAVVAEQFLVQEHDLPSP